MKDKIAIISSETDSEIIKNLKNNYFRPIKIPPINSVAREISAHPDMQIFIYKKDLFCPKNISETFLKKVETFCNIHLCETIPQKKYPEDIAYNIAQIQDLAFCKQEYADKKIIDFLNKKNIKTVNVSQGYTKCSTAIIDNSIITADKGIFNIAKINNLNSLLISPGEIELPGYNFGFIGGATFCYKDSVYFTGNLNHHKDKEKIIDFIEQKNKSIVFLSNKKIIDLGSIFILED